MAETLKEPNPEPGRPVSQPKLSVVKAPVVSTELDTGYARQAFGVLRLAFTVAPIVAGADKFFNVLTNWDGYLAPLFPSLLGITERTFMMGVGVIEIIAGIGVALKPRIFSYVVSAWLVGIAINLVIHPDGYYDIALRDVGLALGALALGRLSQRFDSKKRSVSVGEAMGRAYY